MSKVNKEEAQQTSLLDKEEAQQTSLLEVLKEKMRRAREEAEAAKIEADEVRKQIEEERKKREKAEAAIAALNRRVLKTEDRLKTAKSKKMK